MQSFKLTLAYDGAAYCGWQIQQGQLTIQEVLEGALGSVTGETIRVTGSGRTDSGVHALGQVVSFESGTSLSLVDLKRAMNATLPDDMAVVEIAYAPPKFHAIRDAVRKRYRYVLHDGPTPDVFGRRYAWHNRHRLDTAAMHRAAQVLVGRHDFRSFQSLGAGRQTSIRTVLHVGVERRPEPDADRIYLEIEADGFLYNMVRAIVGTLVHIGRGRRPESWLQEVLESRDRQQAGMNAPPHGLFLLRVEFE